MSDTINVSDLRGAMSALRRQHGLVAIVKTLRDQFDYLPGVARSLEACAEAAESEARELRGPK